MAKKQQGRTPLYFYLNGDLHRRLHINRGLDEMQTWNYPQGKSITYSYSDARRRMERAFTTNEVCELLNRGLDSVERNIIEGNIKPPQFTYGRDEKRNKFKYMWHEKDILAAHAYYATVHKGMPRKDGRITPMKMPTERELRAMIRQDEVLYVKVGDKFMPTWQAPDF